MTKQDIINAFPSLYQHPGLFDFSPPKEWLQIIWDLSEKLQNYDIVCVQVKSKFGGLRYYIESSTKDKVDLDTVYILIHQAEEQASKIKPYQS
jgi:hypothetical protein